MRRGRTRASVRALSLMLSSMLSLILAPVHTSALASQQPRKAGSALVVSDVWARPALKGGTGGIYMTIVNKGSAAVTIVSATSVDAASAELHATSMRDGAAHMEMQRVLVIAPGASVTLAPGGRHYMLNKLIRGYAKGDTARLVLRSENGETFAAVGPVRLQ